ncbi:hypothetical protein V495_00797 [Pseudogymnoascus sp. VKM F-4514 (FW-929)]|nr:hypothetical protein V495_00797 [Pseudogymnoascus sp. VKM F-4514 (FW-929)]KFY59429.1 hypothetical protein V497_04294 [Pseudogymnoascus sp. VKM F-4516 (FW-969)]
MREPPVSGDRRRPWTVDHGVPLQTYHVKCVINHISDATYSYAIAGAAKGPKDLSPVVKLAMPVLSQGPSAATPGQRVCVVPQYSSSQTGRFATSTLPFELDLPTWDFSASPYSLDSFDMTMQALANPPPVTLPGFTATQPSVAPKSPGFTPFSPEPSHLVASKTKPAPSLSMQSSGDTMSSASTPQSFSSSIALARIISEYPSLLMKGSFVSPFLHLSLYSLYSNVVPDMTYIPQTSMAICCGGGLNFSENKRFFRRALDAARQRLIGSYDTYACMEKWDALHAMLIYETLDLKESIADDSTMNWSHTPRVTGLGSPFLIKMTECYSESYPALRNPNISVFSDPSSLPDSEHTSTWSRWKTTETARRTIFFANILNFYTTRDHSTRKQSPYYKSLNDELILNMPLPCTEAAWLARTEEDWNAAMNEHQSILDHVSSAADLPGHGSLSTETSLNTILSKYTKEFLQVEVGTNVGFSDSDELRHLIILCATEQFPRTYGISYV